jgi:hypothetical protein
MLYIIAQAQSLEAHAVEPQVGRQMGKRKYFFAQIITGNVQLTRNVVHT